MYSWGSFGLKIPISTTRRDLSNFVPTLFEDRVTDIDVRGQELVLSSAGKLKYDRLLIATGSMPRGLNFENEHHLFGLENVCGFYHLVDLEKLDRLSRKSRRAVITGGGLIGIEVAEMLQSRGIEVDFCARA